MKIKQKPMSRHFIDRLLILYLVKFQRVSLWRMITEIPVFVLYRLRDWEFKHGVSRLGLELRATADVERNSLSLPRSLNK